MKILSINSAKSIALVSANFLNPRGLSLKLMSAALKEKYKFAVSPLEKPINDKDGAQFLNGDFVLPNGPTIAVSMTIHTDGIVVETRSSTENGDLFIEDALNLVHQEFGVPSIDDLPIKKMYASEMVVQFEKMPVFYNEKVISLLGSISDLIGEEKTGPYDFFGLSFATDPAKSERPKAFRFEREINIAFSERRFYTFAQAQTQAHLKVLQLLEGLS